MASSSITSTVFGATGLVGGHIVTSLLGLEAFGAVNTITRRAPPQASDAALSKKLNAIVETDTAQWVAKFSEAVPAAGAEKPIVFSGLGTTRAAAGGIANQWKIDHDLNVDVAKAAKAAGVRTFIFISSAGTHSLISRQFPYSKMKNGVEATIKELDFDQAIIVHPGLILGDRETEHQGAGLFKSIARGIGAVSPGIKDSFAQDADVIAKAAVHAALLASQGKAPSKYWDVEVGDIVRLGRDEWKF